MSQTFKAQQVFDKASSRQLLNGAATVLHCHHYATLVTQLADDAKELNGIQLLAEAAEELAYRELTAYFETHSVMATDDRIALAESYFAFIGLGSVKIHLSGKTGSAEMKHSHVDEGWIKKWGKRKEPVNFIGQGYLAGACAAASKSKPGSYAVHETSSIVAGSPTSQFTISSKEVSS